ncbi:MAG TPA: DUF1801 domain-containing protein [Pyrinomonadaceae bacterium]|nr:DUF1801 domain-containing protein [Pyrinomonadaceae bacterium]
MEKKNYKDIDEYIADFPKDVQKILSKIRSTIRKAAPGSVEVISYQIPTFKLNGNLLSFAAYKNHIGLYPAPRAVAAFKKDIDRYGASKATIRLPLDEPIPYELVTRIVAYRVKQNSGKAKKKTPERSDK